MISRVHTVEEIEESIRELGPMFKNYSGIPGNFRAESFLMSWKMLLEQKIGALFKLTNDEEQTIGLLGAVLVPDLFDNKVVASEAFWFVHPDHRGSMGPVRLFKTFETWAKDVGAERILTAHLSTATAGKMGEFYEKQGYSPVETLYRKEI